MNAAVILLGLLTAVLTTLGAVLLKKAANGFSWKKPINLYIFVSGFSYLASVIPFTLALHEADLSFVYPFTALQYFGACFAGFVLYKENITIRKATGILVLICGILLVGIGK